MLAVSATGTLTLLDPTFFKDGTSSVPSCLCLTQPAVSSAWSLDHDVFFLASAQVIHRYEPNTNSLKDIFTSTDGIPISHILCADDGTIICSSGERILLLECGSTARVTRMIESHKSVITSISLSNDLTLLSTTTSNAVHIHNLTLGSHTVLRGLKLAGQTITTSCFHPHVRTRLLVGAGNQLLLYDITRSSGPLKTFVLSDSVSGSIISLACSTFSKTLAIVGTSAGHVAFVDLEKEKGLFRVVNLKVPLTSAVFSNEGSALYIGTEHGKLLILNLKDLDKPPKSIVISDIGSRIQTISIQKVKGEESRTGTKTAALSSKPLAQRDIGSSRKLIDTTKLSPKMGTPPAKARVIPSAPSTNQHLKESSPSKSNLKMRPEAGKKVFSPVRDPLGGSTGDVSVQLDTPQKAKTPSKSSTRSSPPLQSPPEVPSIRTPLKKALLSNRAKPSRHAGSSHTSSRGRSATSAVPSTTTTTGFRRTLSARSVPQQGTISSSSRVTLSASRRSSDAASTSEISSRNTRNSHNKLPSRLRSAPQDGPERMVSIPGRSRTRLDTSGHQRTPSISPNPRETDLEPIMSLPVLNKAPSRSGMAVLGLETPEVERWIRAGDSEVTGKKPSGKGKLVGLKSDNDRSARDDKENVDEREQEQGLSVQISPRKPSSPWAPSPLQLAPNVAASSAHEFLKGVVMDVMYDFQREHRAEMTGLHLDLIRMGRGWKKDMRSVMQEYTSEINELKEVNRRLREENQRLRRGF